MDRGGWGFAGLLSVVACQMALAGPSTVDKFRFDDQAPGPGQFIIALSGDSQFRVFTLRQPDRVVIDILSARLGRGVLPLPAGTGAVRQVRAANRLDGSVRVVLDVLQPTQPKVNARSGSAGAREIVVDWDAAPQSADIRPPVPPPPPASVPGPESLVAPPELPAQRSIATGPPQEAPSVAAPDPALPPPEAVSGRDIVIAVDAGHGGKDPGAHGPRGVLEKDVTLRIARQLVDVINSEPGMRGVLTRSRDEFVPLRGRMERARAAKADLFVSIHADAVRNRSVKGASVYVLNEKGATDEAARRLAARENAADLIGGVSLRTKDRMLASVLLDLSQNASLSSSIEVADDILGAIDRVGNVRKRRVMQAPFMVLKSPDVPSVLVETAYISNPEEERRLNSDDYRGKLARAIFSGVREYFHRSPPEGTLVAEQARRRMAGNVQHVIRPGESLSAIALRYNVSIGRIRAVNQLVDDRIRAGQILTIPLAQST